MVDTEPRESTTDWTKVLGLKPLEPLLTLELEILSPMFLGGKDGTTNTASARASSVRGLIHWWLRALIGGGVKIGNGNSHNLLTASEMRQCEARVLGDQKRGAQLIVGFTGPSGTKPPLAPHLATYSRLRGSRLALVQPDDSRANDMPELTLRSLPWSAANSAQLQGTPEAMALAGAVWCLVTLGSLGTRSRHGLGALHVESANGPLADAFAAWCAGGETSITTKDVWRPPKNSQGWKAFLQRGLGGAGRAAEWLAEATKLAIAQTPDNAAWIARPVVGGVPQWPCFAPCQWQLVLIQPDDPICRSWQTAVEWIETRVREHWAASTDEATIQSAPSPAANVPIKLDNLEFGMPRTWKVTGLSDVAVKRRRASPLLARPVIASNHTNNGKIYGALFILFRGAVIERGRSRVWTQDGRLLTVPSPSYCWITEFLNNLPGHPARLASFPNCQPQDCKPAG